MASKVYLSANVYDSAIARIERIYDEFKEVAVAFSGGKDSTVLLHLTIEVAERRGRLPVRAMFIDLEGQYRAAIDHVIEMFDDPRVQGEWFCLPINLRNAVSHYQPHWAPWDPDCQEKWIRDMPQHSTVISDPSKFPFWRHRMEFEEFVPEYEEWLGQQLGTPLAVLVGIRSDESLNRFRTVVRDNVRRHKDLKWTTAWSPHCVNCYPIYDWGTEDIWTYISKKKAPYNRLYDWMYLHGTSLHDMRICQPYGDDQRVSLDQFHAIEPDTWFRILNRVEGVNFGALYARQQVLGYRRGLGLPPGHTWKSYTKLLLSSLPPEVAEQYRRNFLTFMLWWKKHHRAKGYRTMFDAGIVNPKTKRNLPSWQRLALCILRNDYWCHSLKFGQTKDIATKQQEWKKKWETL